MTKALRRIFGRSLFTILFVIPLVLLVEIPIFLAGAALGTYLVYSRDLPKIPELASYQPRTVSTFFADDGTVIGVFYHQKRFVVDLEQIPPQVVKAFLAAEDSRFYEHSGVDWLGMARAVFTSIKAGRIVSGGSTITMQVTRNFLLTRARLFSRKIKEMILAVELEKLWGKKKILYIYLNEIYLGEGCYGVEAAARGYFGKPTVHLNVAEAALVAGLVASPARYNPFKSKELARRRQLTVLHRMLRAGFITEAQYQEAKQQQLVFKKETIRPFDLVPDFAEAVRRYIVKKYGAERLYNEGLKVFTTCRVDYQQKALDSLAKGLKEIQARQKHLAILRTIPRDKIPEVLQRRRVSNLVEGKVYQGVVVKRTRDKKETILHVALNRNVRGKVRLKTADASSYSVGHVLAVRFEKFIGDTPFFALDRNPKLQGALVCIENKTGYVRALVGGASGGHFKFNRATQAKRQPGSAFKPIIYATAIEEGGYSPATVIVDEPVEIELETNDDELWSPKNAGGKFLGPVSLRTALELSRNICTIKILMDVKFDPVIKTARRMGITSPLGRNLSLSLGTSEVSLFEITSAYTVFPNGGVYVEPTLVKRIEDRFGNVLEDNSRVPVLDESEIPRPVPRREFKDLMDRQGQDGEFEDEENRSQVQEEGMSDEYPTQQEGAPQGEQPSSRTVRAALSPQTAYIMTSLLQGGVQRGTSAGIRRILNRKDLAGKTGTTNKAEDTWFIGFNPDYTAGVWVGFDEKRPLGRREAGGRAALPIWGYFMKGILDKVPEREFQVPPEIVFVEMPTYVGNSRDGFTPGMVSEPVYDRMAWQTLVISPLDPSEILQEYRPSTPGFLQYGPSAQAYQSYPPAGPPNRESAIIYQTQPAQATPVRPLDRTGFIPPQPGVPMQRVPQAGPPGAPPPAGWNQQPTQMDPSGRYPAYPVSPPEGEMEMQPEARPDEGEGNPPGYELPELPRFEDGRGMTPFYPQGR